jgi:hypothetical protein
LDNGDFQHDQKPTGTEQTTGWYGYRRKVKIQSWGEEKTAAGIEKTPGKSKAYR